MQWNVWNIYKQVHVMVGLWDGIGSVWHRFGSVWHIYKQVHVMHWVLDAVSSL